jgi:hypothetical protein
MHFKKLVILFFMITFALQVNAQRGYDIITKHVSFIGGAENWKKVQSIISSGTYNYNGIVFPFTAYSKAPNQYKYIVPFKGKYFAQAFDGKTGWKIDAFKGETSKTMLNGKDGLAMMNEADVELESPFIDYLKKGHDATLLGVDTVEGAACFKVLFTRRNGDVETYFFKCTNFELVKKQAPSKNIELEKNILDTYYRDYRTVEGITIPFVQESKANNQPVLTITIKKIKLNRPIADAEFKPL